MFFGQSAAMTQYFTLLLDCPLVIVVIFIASIGGTFHYGYCLSAMTSSSPFLKILMNESILHRYNVQLEASQISLIWSFTVSMFCVGGLLGSLAAGLLVSKKKCLLFNNFLVISGALLMLFSKKAASFEMIIVGRFLYGISAGVCLTAHPLYVLECTPKRLSGMVGVTLSTSASFGRFCGQLLGISELLGTEENWPWLLGFTGFTALFQLVTLPFLPESPSFLLLQSGDHQACEKALKRLRGDKDYSREVEEMLEEKAALQCVRSRSVWELIQDQTVRWQLITIVICFITLQFSGITAVYFYSSDVFRTAGMPEEKLPYAAVGTGLCEVFTSAACCMLIENTGRKVLMFRGYIAMALTLALVTITLYFRSHVSWMPYCSMVLIFVFIFFYAIGPGAVTAPLPSQIFPQAFKSAAYTVACTLSWTVLFMLGLLFPLIVESLDYFCFVIFLVFCLACGTFVKFNIPEMKNQTALEIAAAFERMHGKSGESETKTSIDNSLYETKL
ncbi:solute carrier family 2 member 11, like isoform X2 [Gouania willdenowi]|uniref:solute carrier family 2 member 11, like isoform X2 n=1 Tax=Gouania willdenowi TaxID=441366 RepID=UPI0010547D88|nr:solute carrier family 2, facilitated glucose transporter member 11-like isoform X2 [Gouania willdenowi]